jgi:23S rRNA (adenine2030-N6)-methyltransferase
MNYRHVFHAGNYGDVFKHVMLLRLLRAQQRKEKGYLYVDTHAGRGAYDLGIPPAPGRQDRAPEWPQGVGRLWAATNLPPALDEYVTLVRSFSEQRGGGQDQPRYYPGSPWFAALVQRPQDRLALWEAQPEEADALRGEFSRQPRTALECADGYGALRAALPPPERRAVVLMDPPFEQPDEFDRIFAALREGLQRFPSGVYAVWYPVTERARAEAFRASLKKLALPPTLWAELAVTADPQVRMKGCGLLILNPPWQFADELRALLPVLAGKLGADAGASARSEWLVPEV